MTTISSNSNDRISDLPEAVLHRILSLLDMKQVVQTSIISKRWISLWKSVPNINIHQEFWLNRNSDEKSGEVDHDKCQNFVDKVLQLRDDSVHINKFSLCYEDIRFKLVDKWITCAVTQHHAEEFLLERVYLKGPIHHAPTYLGHVKTLNLRSVFIPNMKKYAFNLPTVENFILYAPNYGDSEGTSMLVSAPCLKRSSVWDYQGGHREKCINICAPNLTYLLLKGKSYRDYNMGNLPSLETAEIDLRFDHEELFITCLDKLLKQIHSAKSLTMSVRCFQEFPNGLKQVPISFHNVKYLKLTTWITNGPIGPMAELLESFPNVETLVLKSAKVSYDLGIEEDWELRFSFQSILSHLKTIEIHDIKGCEHELKFLEFLVKNAVVLENITMKATKKLSGDKEMELIDFCKKLQLLFTASLVVTICLMVQRETGLTTLFKESSRSSISSFSIEKIFYP